jgi:hypothetical protein
MERDPNYTGGSRLESLKGSNFEIVDNEPHILGWTIKDQEGRTIGEVDDLIFDPASRRVRYIVMDLEGNVLDLEPRDVLVPIGIAELHPSDDDVILPGVTADHLRGLPPYKSGSITRDMENSVVSAFSSLKGAVAGAAGAVTGAVSGTAADVKDDFYTHEHFNEERTYRNRPATPLIREESELSKKEAQTGSTEIRPRIVEKSKPTDSPQSTTGSTQSTTGSAQPIIKPTQPPTNPTQPTTGSTQSATGSTQYTTNPNQSTTGPTQPNTGPTQPTTDPTQPNP